MRHFYLEIRSVARQTSYNTVSSVSRGSLNGICLAERALPLESEFLVPETFRKQVENRGTGGRGIFPSVDRPTLSQGVEHPECRILRRKVGPAFRGRPVSGACISNDGVATEAAALTRLGFRTNDRESFRTATAATGPTVAQAKPIDEIRNGVRSPLHRSSAILPQNPRSTSRAGAFISS